MVLETIEKVDAEVGHELVKLDELQKYRIELTKVLVKLLGDSGRAAAGPRPGKTGKK
jgi:hypothetical protein